MMKKPPKHLEKEIISNVLLVEKKDGGNQFILTSRKQETKKFGSQYLLKHQITTTAEYLPNSLNSGILNNRSPQPRYMSI